MMAIAPNLTVLVGELVGARLIAHAGSLLNLAKHPSSTVQILGAEKALFRALKTKHDTPKYGLIYHASLVGQSNAKHKGKISRTLAAKASLAIRVDALGEGDANTDFGMEHRAKLESRLRSLEEGNMRRISGTGKARAKWDKYENKSEVVTYDAGVDSTLPNVPKKRKIEEISTAETQQSDSPAKKKKKVKADAVEVKEEATDVTEETPKKKKKKKKDKSENADVTMETTLETTMDSTLGSPQTSGEKKKKKKKKKSQDE